MSKPRLPFELSICGLDELADEMETFDPSHIVSILDPDADRDNPLVFPESIRVLSLRFFDFHSMGGLVGKALARQGRNEHPGVDHAESIIKFGRGIPGGSRVLCHCWAGVSRSTAAAFLLARLHLPATEAMKLIMGLRPEAMPNRLILKFGEEIFCGNQRRGVGCRSIKSIRR